MVQADPHFFQSDNQAATCTVTALALVRRSTLRKNAKMHALIAELRMRELSHFDAANFLNCSSTSARSYMKELAAAEVVMMAPQGDAPLVIDRALYRITGDVEVIADFLDSQKETSISPQRRSKGFNGPHGGRYLHIVSDDVKFPVRNERIKVRRDPLVAALFGSAPSASKA